MNILVTGSTGQLGDEISKLSSKYAKYNFTFKSRNDLDISDSKLLDEIIANSKIEIIINCAAYTDVENAEMDKENADIINNISVDRIAKICSDRRVRLIHISTDFVFDGKKNEPYTENDYTNPLNYYGISKLNGEKNISKYSNLSKSIIIRTSWLYSNKKNNFVSKILNKINYGHDIYINSEEFGSPTNAKDLAELILSIIPKLNNEETEIYHFSNSGICSRFDFANEIINISNSKSQVYYNKLKSNKVERPKYSALDTNKISNDFKINIKHWKESLRDHLNQLN
tara:strand:+ start:7180 stop:8034 length:855 start_codon:yes stop_codon:yes gene_type:complete